MLLINGGEVDIMNHRLKKILTYFLIVFTTIIITLIFFETFHYLTTPKISSYYVWEPNFEYIFFPNSSILYGINGESHFTINNLGYRGVEFNNHENEYRILIIGGSTSECLYLDNEEAWPYILMGLLKKTKDNKKVITINIGKSGHGLRNNLLELKYLPDNYEPDLLIMMLGVNDLLHTISMNSSWRPFNEAKFDVSDSYTFVSYPGYSWRSTVTYKIYRYFNLKLKNIIVQDAFGNGLADNRLLRTNSKDWLNSITSLDASVEDYGKNLERVIELSREKNITLIFSTQPYLWKNDMSEKENSSLWMTTDFRGNFYSTEIMVEAMEKFNNKMLEVCKENPDIFCIDLEKDVPKTLDYLYDDVHFNEKGSISVAEKLGDYIKNNIKEFNPNL